MTASAYAGQPGNALSRPAIGPLAQAAGSATASDEYAISGDERGQLRMFWDTFRSHRMAHVGLIILTAMVACCIVLPFFLSDPNSIDMDLLRADAPSMAHPLGTDSLGRDVLSRTLNAGRKSLLIGFWVAMIAGLVGSTVGVMAGYYGGRVDGALMWLVGVLLTIPTLPLMIAMSALSSDPNSSVGATLTSMGEIPRIIIVMSILSWMGLSRMVRSQVMSLREQEFCEAAIALGAKDRRVMFLHILPNSISVIAVFTTMAVSGAIIGESALSFLGLGVQPPTATWGNMLNEARDLFTILKYWWLTWFPALAIFLTVLSVNFIGDGVRDALDPKSLKK